MRIGFLPLQDHTISRISSEVNPMQNRFF